MGFNGCVLSLRYSLTEEGLALAERLQSAEQETEDGPEEVRSEGEEEEEEEGLVDLTASDDDDEEEKKEEDRSQ